MTKNKKLTGGMYTYVVLESFPEYKNKMEQLANYVATKLQLTVTKKEDNRVYISPDEAKKTLSTILIAYDSTQYKTYKCNWAQDISDGTACIIELDLRMGYEEQANIVCQAMRYFWGTNQRRDVLLHIIGGNSHE